MHAPIFPMRFINPETVSGMNPETTVLGIIKNLTAAKGSAIPQLKSGSLYR